MSKRTKAEDRQDSIAWLREHVPAGSTVYGIVRSVSRSGMSRRIDFYSFTTNGPLYLTGFFSTVYGGSIPRARRGMLVNGCGMDMVFAVVSNVSSVVHGPPSSKPGPFRYAWRSEVL